MEWRDIQKIQFLGLGDYLDLEYAKEKEVKHGAQVSGLGNLMDGNEIDDEFTLGKTE